MRHPFVAVALAAAALRLACGPAGAHDIWTDAREYNKPGGAGFPCCGGNELIGDCEGLGEDQVWDQPNGDVEIWSNRYKARIHIPQSRIMVDLPRYTDGERKGQALDPLVRFAAHYCGVKRTPLMNGPTPDDPDPNFRLYCFFRNGGGM